MPEGDIERLQSALLADHELAGEFAKDPRTVAAAHGVTLTDEEHENIRRRTAGAAPHEVQAQVQTDGVKGMA